MGALALSSSETAAIRRYLDDGGVVVADSEPGLYDEHCHKRAAGSLHDCLPPKAATSTVGKGRFILYRGLDSRFADTRGYGVHGQANSPATEATLASLSKFSTVLARQVGLEPNFRIRAGAGSREQGARSSLTPRSPLPAPRFWNRVLRPSSWSTGRRRYVACVIDGKEGQTFEVHLSLSGSGHVYDCRAGKYLGPAGERTVELRALTGNLFALLPYRVEGLEVASPARAALGRPIEVKVAVTAVGGPLARHVIVLQLRRPDGKDLPQNRWILETEKGSAASQPLPGVERPGRPLDLAGPGRCDRRAEGGANRDPGRCRTVGMSVA